MTEKKAPKRRRYFAPLNSEGGALQAPRDECNINSIVNRFETTGYMPQPTPGQGIYGDFSNPGSLHDALNLVIAAQEGFEALPPQVRRAAKNDVVEFSQMLHDDEGREILAAAGLDFIPAQSEPESEPSPPAQGDAEPPEEAESTTTT